ncbi:histidine kinase N-terminal domain-containing protein [Arcanobacterium haemolyticum]|nr:histidine kinase N-terminal domain-containing protein [Arcanobacterium haemolyticum]
MASFYWRRRELPRGWQLTLRLAVAHISRNTLVIFDGRLYPRSVPTLTNILGRSSVLTPSDRDWLHQLVGDWQVIADVAFADVLLAIPNGDDTFTIAAHCRPATAVTFFDDDVVGDLASEEFTRSGPLVLADGRRRSMEIAGLFADLYPVVHEDRRIALLCVASAYVGDRVSSQALSIYEEIADKLLHMVGVGEFPFDGAPTGYRHGTPRVIDGFLLLNDEGEVTFANPNAVSNFHRLGITGSIQGSVLVELVTDIIEDHSTVDESLPVVVMGRAPWLTEIEVHGTILSLRAVPLYDKNTRWGAVLLCRDITELRHREMELLTKDATIREINHRVKNNLQTVSALLRLQARRATNTETQSALEDAQRRVATIALVHQTLSETIDETVDFDNVFGPLLRMASDIAATGVVVNSQLIGSFGRIGANQTTALAVVLNELVSNAVEHGLPHGGDLSVTANRDGDHLVVYVDDDGEGLGGDKKPGSGLGTKIVRTMVAGELKGTITWGEHEGGGTRVTLDMTIDE